MNPLKCHHLVEESKILGIRVILAVRQMRQVDKSQSSQAISHGYQDDLSVIFHKIETIV